MSHNRFTLTFNAAVTFSLLRKHQTSIINNRFTEYLSRKPWDVQHTGEAADQESVAESFFQSKLYLTILFNDQHICLVWMHWPLTRHSSLHATCVVTPSVGLITSVPELCVCVEGGETWRLLPLYYPQEP